MLFSGTNGIRTKIELSESQFETAKLEYPILAEFEESHNPNALILCTIMDVPDDGNLNGKSISEKFTKLEICLV